MHALTVITWNPGSMISDEWWLIPEMEENVCVLREVCVLHAVKDFILLLCAIFLVPSNVVVKIKKSIPLKYILLNYIAKSS